MSTITRLRNTLKHRITTRHKRYKSWRNAAKSVKRLRGQLHKAQKNAKTAGPTVMYDAITVGNIPADAPAVAGYVAGRWPTFPTLQQRFPHARKLSIAVASTQDAECLDVEPGDSTPQLAPGWVKRQHARGVKRPVIYCSVSAARDVMAHLSAAGIARSEYRLWTAHYTFREHRCTSACGFGFTGTADATQWIDKAHGRSLDQSLCGPGFWE